MQIDPSDLKRGRRAAGQVSHGLNLTLELKDPRKMPLLLAQIFLRREATRVALDELHFVHYARFLPVRNNTALLVITEFDGPLQPYVMDFVIAIGDVFTLILSYVKDAEHLTSVKDQPREFWDFVQKNNRVVVVPKVLEWDDFPVYSAYPDRTVLDTVGKRTTLPPPVTQARAVPIAFNDVQGNVLRGYHAGLARHYALEITSAKAARLFLHEIVDGKGTQLPLVTSAAPWATGARPLYFLNVGVTAEGLKALGISDATLKLFPDAFLDGPADAKRADANGDRGDSAPKHWELGAPGQQVHLLVSLYADASQVAEFNRRDAELVTCWGAGGLHVVHHHDAAALPGDKVHFGYREGMAQPRIAGVSDTTSLPDMQPLASVGEFLLGKTYKDVYGGSSLGRLPADLCENASFAAVRLLEQDVAAFERLLDEASTAHGLDRELIAAKLMGRWRDGTPLSRVPSVPAGEMPPIGAIVDYNDFDYAPSHENPLIENDHEGLLCPVGAHVRRMNPRSARVAGRPHSRRIIRRGLPFGPVWNSAAAPVKRGLYGMFICADLERQFEFIMQSWANGDIAASGIQGTQDPFIGDQSTGGDFRFPVSATNTITLKMPRLVATRGSVYVMLPGLGGLRHLASLSGGLEQAVAQPTGARPSVVARPVAVPGFDPVSFDPKDAAFLADPYPFYARFRSQAPVALVRHGGYASYWVFDHALVTQVCNDTTLFLKRPKESPGPPPPPDRGLFYMDPPRHTEVRGTLDPLFVKSIASISTTAKDLADEAIADLLAQEPQFDLITAYAKRVARNAFMSMFGVPRTDWESVGKNVDTVLKHFDQMLSNLQRAPALFATNALLLYFKVLGSGCPAHAGSNELLCLMEAAGKSGSLRDKEVTQTALHFALGGYLSTEFLIGTGFHNLLSQGGAAIAQLRANPADLANAIEEMKRYDAPFQMADRYAAEDTTLGGCTIGAGKMVTVVYGSANRDAKVFGATADQFLIDRTIPAGKNYVFGHGIHYCIGAPMVSAVAPVVFEKLIQAMPGLRLTSAAPARVTDPYFRAFSRLELTR